MKFLRPILLCIAVAFALFSLPASLNAGVLQVGPGKPFAMPCAAIAAAAAGDTIEIDTAGNYVGDVCAWTTNNLHLVGVGTGRAVIDANGRNAQGKGIWVINNADGTVVENIEFRNAAVPDMNGAGIRIDGGSLTVRNCVFRNNEDGILAGDSPGTLLVEFSEFDHNGAGDGFSHNIYVGHYAKFIFRYNWSHRSVVGHLVKSRAAESDILYNRLTDEDGTGSYEIDLPNGGLAYIIGNLIEQGPQTGNSTIISFEAEGAGQNTNHQLFVVNNTIVNDYTGGTFIFVNSSVAAAVIRNNIFTGPGSITNQAKAILDHNFTGNPQFVNAASLDYHLTSGSGAMDAGTTPGTGAGVSLTPASQYVHPSCAEGRNTVGTIDIGGYELGGGTGTPPANAPSRCGTTPPPAGPSVAFAPSSLNFGSQDVNTSSAAQTVKLSNTGNAILNIAGITINGANSGDFAQTNTCSASLAAGANCSIQVTFTPAATGARSASLNVTDNAPGSPQSVSLTGAGTNTPPPAPATSLAPASLSFGNQVINTSSAPQTITMTNSGNATLNIAGIAITGANGGDFIQTNTCGSSLAAGANCSIRVTFTPATTGARSASLAVTDDAAGSPHTAGLSGTGTNPPTNAPAVSLSPTSLSFAAQVVATSSAAAGVKLTNTGGATLNISTIALSGVNAGDFTQANACGSTLAAGASCTINVTFKPSAGGSRAAALTITDNASGSPHMVSLSGTGSDFSLSLSSTATTVNAGQAVNLTLAVSPDGGFAQSVAISCSGAPAAASCVVSPSTVSLNGSTVSSANVTVTTTARSFGAPRIPWGPVQPGIPVAVLAGVIVLIVTLSKLRRQWWALLSIASMLVFACLAGGCSGVAGNSSTPPPQGTPAGTSTIVLTAASGNLSRSASFQLSVK